MISFSEQLHFATKEKTKRFLALASSDDDDDYDEYIDDDEFFHDLHDFIPFLFSIHTLQLHVIFFYFILFENCKYMYTKHSTPLYTNN